MCFLQVLLDFPVIYYQTNLLFFFQEAERVDF